MAGFSYEHTCTIEGITMLNTTKQGYSYTTEWSEENKLYICKVEKLPGCMSDGHTTDEAVTNLERIVEEWLETAIENKREIPKP